MPLHGLSRRQPHRMLRLNALDKQRDDPVGPVLRAPPGDLAVQPVAIGEGDLGDLLVGEGGEDDRPDHAGVVGLRRWPLLTGVLLEVPLAEVRHRRRATLGLEAASGSLPLARSSSFSRFASALAVASGQSG